MIFEKLKSKIRREINEFKKRGSPKNNRRTTRN